jgi:hypothetical protein
MLSSEADAATGAIRPRAAGARRSFWNSFMVLTPIEGARYTSDPTILNSTSAAIRRNYATMYSTAHGSATKKPQPKLELEMRTSRCVRSEKGPDM